jgi:cytochrome c-type biogenesis protein CcsB
MSTFITFLNNFSFLTLLICLLIYWVRAAFGSFFFAFDEVEKNKKESLWDNTLNKGTLCMLLSNFSMFLLLFLRWKESGHFPLSNLYESLIFLSWTCTVFHLVLENYTQNPWVGCITTPSALFVNAFATFCLPPEMQESSSLVPALQSNWLMMHVTVMILSYAALICGSLLAIAYLILTQNLNALKNQSKFILKDFNLTKSKNEFTNMNFSVDFKSKEKFTDSALVVETFLPNSQMDPKTSFVFKSSDTLEVDSDLELASFNASQTSETQISNLKKKWKLANTLDNLSYRILGIGFPFLTIGILSGAVWANEAWGSYWSWDPKETWAFLTWLIYAIYLHTRFTRGWQGQKPAIIASLGFVVVWLCFLGVNLIGEGLHSYGFLNKS